MTVQLLTPTALRDVFRQQHRRVFRFETLQAYAAPDEAPLLDAFNAGKPRPPDPGKDEWTAVVRAGRTGAGTLFQRVHVCREPLSDYLAFELTWSYEPSVAAGEDIRIVPLADGAPWPAYLPEFDFWLFDDRDLYVMRYAPDGSWVGVEHHAAASAAATACGWRSAALAPERAVRWRQYIDARPQLAQHLHERRPQAS